MEDKELTPYEKLMKDMPDQGSVLFRSDDSQFNLIDHAGISLSALRSDIVIDTPMKLSSAGTFVWDESELSCVNLTSSNLQQQIINDAISQNNSNLITSGFDALKFETASPLNLFDVEPVEDPKDKEIRELKETVNEQGEQITELIDKVDELQTSQPKNKIRTSKDVVRTVKRFKEYEPHLKRLKDLDDYEAKDTTNA